MNRPKAALTDKKAPSFVQIFSILILTIFSGSLSGPFIRILYNDGWNGAWITSLRMTALLILVWLGVLFSKNLRRDVLFITKKDMLWILLSGLFMAMHFFFWSFSLKNTSIFGSSSICSVQYLLTVLIAFVFLKEKPGKGTFAGIALSFIGVAIISWSDFKFSGDISGSLFAVAASIASAVYFVAGRHIRKTVSLGAYTTWVSTFSAVMLFFAALLIQEPFKPMSFANISVFFALALFCSLGGHLGINWSLKYVTADVASMATLSGPVFSAILAYLFFMEKIRIEVVIGSAFILFGIVFYMLIQNKERRKLRRETPEELTDNG